MKLDNSKREALLARTVAVVLELRRQYLAAGANPLKHWQQLHDRLRMATRTTTSVAEWATRVQAGLQLGVPSSSLSSAVLLLEDEVACIPQPAWLDLLEREHAHVMALARKEAEDRREQRLAETTATIDPKTGEVME
jgi:hypothetical protein